MSDFNYIKSMQLNKDKTIGYYKKSISKTSQQQFLEEKIIPTILPKKFYPELIADIACGGGL